MVGLNYTGKYAVTLALIAARRLFRRVFQMRLYVYIVLPLLASVNVDWFGWLHWLLAQVQDVSLLRSDYFRVGVPLFSAALSIWIKTEMRHPQRMKITKEDLAVGIDLIQTSFISFLALATDKALRLYDQVLTLRSDPLLSANLAKFLTSSAVRLTALLLLLFGISSFVRRTGWRNQDDIKVWRGIVIPIVAGVLCLYAVIGLAGASVE